MKIFICLFLFVFPAFSQNNKDFDDFLNALSFVESSNNPKAYNKGENAIGLYQIRAGYFKDAQDFNKQLKKYNHNDCFNPNIAKIVVISYFQKYEQNNLNNWEILAKCHNGGAGWRNGNKQKQKNLEIYWQKIKARLNVRNRG